MSLATNLRSRGRFGAALSASIIYLFLQFFDVWRFQQLFTGTPQYQGGMKPPIVTWAESKPEGEVYTLLGELFDKAEKEAKKETVKKVKPVWGEGKKKEILPKVKKPKFVNKTPKGIIFSFLSCSI